VWKAKDDVADHRHGRSDPSGTGPGELAIRDHDVVQPVQPGVQPEPPKGDDSRCEEFPIEARNGGWGPALGEGDLEE